MKNKKLSLDEQNLCVKLRLETGDGLMDCRTALRESEWDIEKAKEFLIQYHKRPGLLH